MERLSRGVYLAEGESYDYGKAERAVKHLKICFEKLKTKNIWLKNRAYTLYLMISIGELINTLKMRYFNDVTRDDFEWNYHRGFLRLLRNQICHDPINSISFKSGESPRLLRDQPKNGGVVYIDSGFEFENRLLF